LGGGSDQDPEDVQRLTEEDCPFCAIARGDIAAPELIADEPEWLAFFPPEPATPGHTLIIPREHLADVWQASQELTCTLAVAARRVGRALRMALNPDGLNLITSAGAVAEQTVFHAHLHIVPRWKDDGFGALWPPHTPSSPESLAELGARLRVQLARR
jgi:histidine triad (HIT) family protein